MDGKILVDHESVHRLAFGLCRKCPKKSGQVEGREIYICDTLRRRPHVRKGLSAKCVDL